MSSYANYRVFNAKSGSVSYDISKFLEANDVMFVDLIPIRADPETGRVQEAILAYRDIDPLAQKPTNFLAALNLDVKKYNTGVDPETGY